MTSVIYLEDLPQLVMEKITSFLDHKQLLALEQVSRTLKCIVDSHLSVTDHLIIGPLPKVEYFGESTAKDKKCLNGLLKTIKRCGVRLRTIQITTTYNFTYSYSIRNYRRYCKHLLASAEVSSNCPNIESIITSSNIDIITMLDDEIFRPQYVLLDADDAGIYSNNIKLSTGGTCKLRSVKLSFRPQIQELQLLNLFSNLEQISVYTLDENFYKFLPQFIENGLKDLSIIFPVNVEKAKKYCNIWKDLRTLRVVLSVENKDDIAAINKLQLPENIELRITICNVDDCFLHLNENVCHSIIDCVVYGPTDFKQISKLKNLEQFSITNSVCFLL